MHGEFVEGSFHAHQVPLAAAKTDGEERQQLQEWLTSYGPKELFPDGVPNAAILSVIPEQDELKLGQKKEAYASYEPLDVPDWKSLAVKAGEEQSCMKLVGELLHEVVKQCVLLILSDYTYADSIRTEIQRRSVFSPPTSLCPISLMPSCAIAVATSSGILHLAQREAE